MDRAESLPSSRSEGVGEDDVGVVGVVVGVAGSSCLSSNFGKFGCLIAIIGSVPFTDPLEQSSVVEDKLFGDFRQKIKFNSHGCGFVGC